MPPRGHQWTPIERAGVIGVLAIVMGALLAFARRQVQRPEVLVLDDVIAELEPMLERLIRDDVELVTVHAPEPWPVKVDRSHVDQVVMNLAVNARDAMPDGGRLEIATSNAELDAGYAAAHLGVEPGRYVLMSVSDTGVGIDQETQARIFEPFFTTKEEGKGSGLGLATVIGIVEQSGGHLRVYSEPGHGTTFRIYLPTTDDDELVEPRTPAAGRTAEPRGTETVMVVEDDEGIRRLLLWILSDAGYEAIVADGPEDALRLSAAREGAIDLLITDMIMPGMTGREVADRLNADRPGMRVLFMSGYTGDAMIHRGLLEPGAYFLGKPFSPAQLAKTLRAILDDPE